MTVTAGVVLCGGAGGVLRFMVDGAVGRRVKRSFPFGTLAVNISASAMMGLVSVVSFGLGDLSMAAIGGYSTFSTWMLETQRLGEERQSKDAIVNVVISLLLGFLGALLGQWISTATLGHPVGGRL
jgi:CrcB protein